MKPIVTGNDWFIPKPVLEVSAGLQTGITALMTGLAIITIIYAISVARRTGTAAPVYICIGAALAAFYEPLGDLFVHVAYHEVNQVNFVSSFGYRVPLWIVPTYIFFFGLPFVSLGKIISDGIGLKRWMMFYFAIIPSAWLFEVPMLELGYIDYYDPQPLKILGYPLSMGFVNAATSMAAAGVIHLTRQIAVIRAHPILLVAIVPLSLVGVHASASLPLASALNSSSSQFMLEAMALLSMAAAVLLTFIVGSAVSRAPEEARVKR